MKEIELIGKRKAREKHFLKQNGVIEAQVFDEDIHFLKNGIYEEIDNTLIDKGDCYTNKNNAYEVKLYKNTSDNLMEVSIDDKFIKTRLLNPNLSELTENVIESKLHKNVCYPNILDNIDLEYNVLPTKVKEAIILKNKNVCVEKLVFSIETNMKLRLLENKKIIAEKDGNQMLEFDAPYMIDNEFKTNNNVFYELTKCDCDKYSLKIKIDEDWLKDENTKYPVMIDPTITNSGQNNSVYDTYIYPGDTGIDRNNQDILKAGFETKDGVKKENRTLIKFDLPTIGTGSQVISADLKLYGYPETEYNVNDDLILVHQITTEWEENTATWDNMHDKYNSLVEGVIFCRRGYYDYENETVVPANCDGDVTRLVRKWYTGTPNYGIMLKCNDVKYNENILPAFYSKNNKIVGGNPKPLLSISYRNQNGLLNYMDYQSQTFSEGIVYVNNYNGNLTTIFDVGSTISGKMPVGLKLIYNTNDVVLNNDYGYGLGYKLSLHQIIREQKIDNNTYLEYTDEDGTLHYFLNKKVSFGESGYETTNTENVYYDEDGLDMTITKNDNDYILKDKFGNSMKFIKNGDKAYLSEIEDVSGNKNTIKYSSENRIEKIIDANNAEINFIYDTTTISVISPDKMVVLNYSNNKLHNINGKFGITEFEYNENNIISKIKDTNGISTYYEYYSQKPYKLRKIYNRGIEESIGEKLEISYGFDSTTIIDSNGFAKNIVFNSQGGVVSTSNLKEKDDICNAYGLSQLNGTNDGTNPGYNNKLIRKEIPLKYVKNFLYNTSFEKEEIKFTATENIELTISNEVAQTGNNSLKAVSTKNDQELIQIISVPKGKFYTFSAYIKNTGNTKLKLSYVDINNTMVETTGEIINPSDDFERYDVTIEYPENAASDLYLKICLDEIGISYIDDIQLELGKVANNYNLLENSDFSNGLSDWDLSVTDNGEEISTNDYFKVVDVSSKIKALKIKANPIYNTNMSKTFNISGKGGDVFNISFWYKNQGINSNLSENYGSRVHISFNYTNQDDGHCEIPSPILNPNDVAWQYVSNSFFAEKDYSSIVIDFHREYDANDLYITNLNLFKDIRNIYYEYDEFGNVILENDLDNQNSEYNYNKNNQLIRMTSSKGKNFAYEYDNVIVDKLMNKISDLGISNKIIYDGNDNPKFTKILKNNVIGDISNGLYKIRLKGTNKYLRNISNSLKMVAEDCNHDIWKLEKENEYFKIHHFIISDKYISVENDNIILASDDTQKDLFKINKNKNGSYSIVREIESTSDDGINQTLKKYVKYNDDSFELAEFIEDDYHFEFYFETVDSDLFIENVATYSDDGKFIKSITDSLGGTTIYDVDSNTGLTKSESDAKGNIINYNYNTKKQLTTISSGDKKVSYIYNDNNLLSKITHGTKEYNFIYDEFLNIKTIKIGENIILVNNNYNSRGDIKTITYGNGDTINYEYDEYYRMKKIVKANESYNLEYDNNGNLVKIISKDDVIKYIYDLSKLLSEYRFNEFKIKYKYDSNQNITNIKYKFNDIIKEIESTYNDDDLIIKTEFDNTKFNYTYDELGRVKSSNINGIYNMSYGYIGNGKKTTEIINEFTTGNDHYFYKYNKLGSITHIYHNNKLENKYYYNNYNELIEEKNYLLNIITKYNYDNIGNMLSKETYNSNDYNLIDIKNYRYDNSEWQDLLTKYDDVLIDYDTIGNPISIGNNIHLNWVNGRQLDTYTDLYNTISYKYNVDGIRISKTINNVETKYYLENNDIVFEKTGNNMLYYIRSTMDDLIGFKYNDDLYYYVKNIQDDIIGILDSNLNIVANYKYDSWGKIISITDGTGTDVSENHNHIANINPYRYRSYYYDKETKLYYLNSRYYNPEWCRFINADGHISTGQGLNSNNMFCYCGNNPIDKSDVNGMFWKRIRKAIKKVVNKIKKKVKSIFGAGKTTKSVISTPKIILPDPLPIVVKSGSRSTTIVSKSGDSSKPISVYADKDVYHPILSSNAGIKINFSKFTLDLNFGLDNTSLMGHLQTDDSTTKSFGLKLNLSELKLGFEGSKKVKWDKSSDQTTYTNVSVNGWFLLAVCILVNTGQVVIPETLYG